MSRQTVTSGNSWLRANNQWSLNADDQAADQFSALDTLEKHRAASGAFTLQLVFPGTDLPPQTWKQTSNPVTATRSHSGVEGYEPIDVPHTGCYWGGLERSGGSSLLDGWTAPSRKATGGTRRRRAQEPPPRHSGPLQPRGAAARAVGPLLVGIAHAAAKSAAVASTSSASVGAATGSRL